MTDFISDFFRPEVAQIGDQDLQRQGAAQDATPDDLTVMGTLETEREPTPIEPAPNLALSPLPYPAGGPVVPIPTRDDPSDAWSSRRLTIEPGVSRMLEGADNLRRRIVITYEGASGPLIAESGNAAPVGFPVGFAIPTELRTTAEVWAYASDLVPPPGITVVWFTERDDDPTSDRLR